MNKMNGVSERQFCS